MIIHDKCSNGKLELTFTPEKDDHTSRDVFNNVFKTSKRVTLGAKQCVFHLPADWTTEAIHPDAFALAMMAIIYPFCGSRIRMPRSVSKDFHKCVRSATNIRILPVNGSLKPRQAPANAVPALSYSGGIDSTAATALLPKDTHLFYIDRMVPKGRAQSLLNQEAARYACDAMASRGKQVHKIKTDMPYVRHPVGFNTFLADAVPALLLADYYGFDATAHGQTLEVGYQVGHQGYQDPRETEVGRPWLDLLAAVDMPYTLPTIGLSEVATTRIARLTPYYEFSQPCSRGHIKQPCMNCFQCFRKSLLDNVTTDTTLDDTFLDRLFNIPEVKSVIKQTPIHFENVLAYITAHYNGDHPDMLALKQQTRGGRLQVDWMEKWHPKAEAFLAPKYRDYVKRQIKAYVDPMTTHDIKMMTSSFSQTYWKKKLNSTAIDKVNRTTKPYVLILVRRFDQLFPKHKVKYEFLQAIEEFAHVTYHHEDGDIRDILKQQPHKPDFIFHYDITGQYHLAPKVTHLDKIDIPIGAYVIDAHWKNQTRQKYFNDNNISLIFSVSKQPFLKRFPKQKSKFRFLPFSINPAHIKDWQQPQDIDFLLMGHIADNYPFRQAVREQMASVPGFIHHKHPGHLEKDRSKLIIDDDFGKEINRAKMFFTCGSVYQYPVMKYFEVLGCNTLLIAEKNADLAELGFRDGVHYVAADRSSFYEKALYYLNHEQERENIAENGYQLIHQHHTNRIRAQQFINDVKEVI